MPELFAQLSTHKRHLDVPNVSSTEDSQNTITLLIPNLLAQTYFFNQWHIKGGGVGRAFPRYSVLNINHERAFSPTPSEDLTY